MIKQEEKDTIKSMYNILRDEVVGLVYSLDVWKELVKIQNESEYFKKWGGHLQHWFAQNYSYRMVFEICKLTDPKKKFPDDLNFIMLLNEIKKQKYISFERFLKTYETPPEKAHRYWNVQGKSSFVICNQNFTVEDAKKSFEDITGYPYNTKDYSEIIDTHIMQLNEIFENLKDMRSKKLGHLTTTEIKKIPTYRDIENYIEIIKQITKYYGCIINNSIETFHYYDLNIRTVFKEAWIK